MATLLPAKKPTRKAQVSIELTLLLAMLLVVFAVLFNTTLGRDSIISEYRLKFSASTICDQIAASINLASNAGNGAQISLNLPSALTNNVKYNLSVYSSSRTVEIKWPGKRYNAVITTANINSTNLNAGTTITIRNTQGMISIA